MKMRKLFFVLITVCGALLPPTIFAAPSCGDQDFTGTYGIMAEGAITVPGFPITGPFAQAGQARADGAGNVVMTSVLSYNGFLFNATLEATYVVASDCTITIQVPAAIPLNQPQTFRGILSEGGREFSLMMTNPLGQTMTAVLTKQDNRTCSAKDLSGAYAVLLKGAVVTPAVAGITGQFVRGGKLVADGAGNFTAETSANYNGFLIQPENFSGTYTVAGDCSLTLQYDQSGVSNTWMGALVKHSGRAIVIVSSPTGFAIVGTLDRQ